VKEEYGGEGGGREVILRGDERLILGALDLQRGVKFWEWDCISQAPGLLEVLGTGARISI
jgi:hypothetical protein